MLINDAAPKGLIYELSALHDYGYSQTYVLLIFLTREFLAKSIFFLATVLIMTMFNFQF